MAITPPHGSGLVPPERRGWRRRARAIFLERLGLKATALVIAVLLWLVVGARQQTEGQVAVHLVPELDSALVLLDPPPRLRALVAGRAADIVKLYASPLVLHRTIDGDVPDTLMLDVTPGDVHVPPEMAGDVRVLDVQPRSVMLRFETRASRRVPVVNDGRVTMQLDSGIVSPARVRFEPETVRITGPRRLVLRLRGIRPESLAIVAGDTIPHVADLDTAGLGVRVSPAQVKVRLREPAAVATPEPAPSPTAAATP